MSDKLFARLWLAAMAFIYGSLVLGLLFKAQTALMFFIPAAICAIPGICFLLPMIRMARKG